MRHLMRSHTVAVAMAALMVVTVSACSDDTNPAKPTTNGATGSGKITIGISGDLPGLSLKDGSTFTGFDIDVANYVAGKLDVPSANITWKVIDQADRVSALTSGQVDLVVSTFSITPERQKQVDFAGPYFIAHQDILIRRNDEEITGPQTLNDKVLCAAAGTTSADYVKAHYKGHITLREVPTWAECVRNLSNGDVDAVSTDDVLLAGFASLSKYKGELKVIGKGFNDERYGVGVKKGDARLPKINVALQEFISSGAWKKPLDANVAPSGYSIPSAPKVGS